MKNEILIKDGETLAKAFEESNLNAMEKVMALRLLEIGYEFYVQFRIDTPEELLLESLPTYVIVDFFIPSAQIAIETEGKIHSNTEVWTKDINRFNLLAAYGLTVFRFRWDDVMGNNNAETIGILISLGHGIFGDRYFSNFQEGVKSVKGAALMLESQ